jgi:hypothetical protein
VGPTGPAVHASSESTTEYQGARNQARKETRPNQRERNPGLHAKQVLIQEDDLHITAGHNHGDLLHAIFSRSH